LKRQQIILALLRGFFLGAGAAWAFSIDFGLLFGLLTVTALLLAYRLGFSPGREFEWLKRPHLSRRKLLGSLVRAILLALAAVLANWIKPVSAQPFDFGLHYGLMVGGFALEEPSATERRLGISFTGPRNWRLVLNAQAGKAALDTTHLGSARYAVSSSTAWPAGSRRR
jgi:hypothetical protein